jgi:hypothetical protein
MTTVSERSMTLTETAERLESQSSASREDGRDAAAFHVSCESASIWDRGASLIKATDAAV